MIDALPKTELGVNLKLIGHSDAGGYPNLGEGMGIHVDDGRYVLFVAHESAPMAFSVFDVTDPTSPRILAQVPLAHSRMRANNLSLCGETLLVTSHVSDAGDTPAGVHVYDVSNVESPRPISLFDTSGPHSRGAHFASLMDGRYAHVSTGAPDFRPDNPSDDRLYMIVDMEDLAAPRELGRWWLPGQRIGDQDAPLPRHAGINDMGFRPHNVYCANDRPDRAYLGYTDGGIVILDIADRSHPRFVSRLDYHPPFPGFTHTVLPLLDRDLLIVADEAWHEDGLDAPKRLWIVDVREEQNPVIISSMPNPEGLDEMIRRHGRTGAHNLHENEPQPGTAILQQTVVATWFSAGVRVYDIADPFRPEEIAAFVPETPGGQRGSRINDVIVDDRGFIYAGDRASGGLYILEYTGGRSLA